MCHACSQNICNRQHMLLQSNLLAMRYQSCAHMVLIHKANRQGLALAVTGSCVQDTEQKFFCH